MNDGIGVARSNTETIMTSNHSLKPLFVQSGIVKNGKQEAGGIGFPTANVSFEQPDLVSGTYAALVTVAGEEYRAAVYVDQKRGVLEAYLFDFSGSLYGELVTVKLLERIVESKRFRGRQDQKSFIEWAVKEVEKYFHQEE